jgi:hypothetical protein
MNGTILGSTSARKPVRETLVVLAAILCAVVLAALLASPARAATFTVSNTNDSGDGSLRKAITDANAASDADTINVTATGTINLQSELPQLSTAMQINGPGADELTVRRDAGGDYRIFTVPGNQDNCCGNTGGPAVTIKGLTITNGKAPYGGGIKNSAYPDAITWSDLTLDKVAVVGNETTNGIGGGIYSVISKITIKDSLIANNTGPEGTNGGGINITSSTQVNITNTTISGNHAPGGFGGGIYSGDSVNLLNSTLANNQASSGANLYFSSSVSTQILKNTIVADPVDGPNCSVFSGSISYIGSGGNLEYPGTSCSFVTRGVGQGANPLLLPLADNGGPTKTQAIPNAGPAIDGSVTGATTQDQRGVAPYDGDGNGSAVRDIGAYEYVPKPVLSLPANRSVEPNTTEGATVSYQATATDAFNQALDVSCDHTSGSVFPAGETTTVNCSATDSAGQTTTGSFTVTVSKVETGISLGTNAREIPVGKTQTLFGNLTGQFASDLSGKQILVEARPVSGGPFETVDTFTTGANGSFSTSASPTRSTVYRATYTGSSTLAASEGSTTVEVRAKLTLNRSKRTAQEGQRVTVSGVVRPGDPGGPVYLTIKAPGKKRGQIRQLVLSQSSGYRYTFRPMVPGTYTISALYLGAQDITSDTASRKLKVTRG